MSCHRGKKCMIASARVQFLQLYWNKYTGWQACFALITHLMNKQNQFDMFVILDALTPMWLQCNNVRFAWISDATNNGAGLIFSTRRFLWLSTTFSWFFWQGNSIQNIRQNLAWRDIATYGDLKRFNYWSYIYTYRTKVAAMLLPPVPLLLTWFDFNSQHRRLITWPEKCGNGLVISFHAL